MSTKCPIDDRVTAQQGSPAEPRHIGLNSMPTSRVPIKCPIEVGVASEVRNAANPDIMGLYDEMGHFADLSSASSKRLEINAPSPRSPQLQGTPNSRSKMGPPELPRRNAPRKKIELRRTLQY